MMKYLQFIPLSCTTAGSFHANSTKNFWDVSKFYKLCELIYLMTNDRTSNIDHAYLISEI